MNQAADVLSRKSQKLHTHEMHIRRTANGGYIARHDMRDKNGSPPQDGQAADQEYGLNNPAELAAHVAQHMASSTDPQGDENDAPDSEE